MAGRGADPASGARGGSGDAPPRIVAAMWGRPGARRRGPKPRLDLARIARAGIAIADVDGLPAVRMESVAKRLGVSTMSLYRYVRAKDELLLAMDDAATPPPPPRGRRGARAYLGLWALADRDQLLARPWRLDLPRLAPPLGPNGARWWDVALDALGATGLDALECVRVADALDGYAYEAAGSAARLQRDAEEAQQAGRYARALASLVDARQMPALARSLDAGAFDPGDDPLDAGGFSFGLSLLLDGVDRRIRRRAS